MSRLVSIPLAAFACLSIMSACGGDHQDPGQWTVNADIAANASGDAYVAGYASEGGGGYLKRLERDGWATVFDWPGPLNGVWVGESGDLVAVGSVGDVVMRTRDSWLIVEQPEAPAALTATWATSLSDVFAVGHSGLILHYDGSDWQQMDVPTSNDLSGVWGAGANDVVAVGDAGTILRFDGSLWELMPVATTEDLNDVWGSSSDNVYAVGGSEQSRQHVVLQFDGASWNTVRTGEPYALLGIHGSEPDNIYAVGAARNGERIESAVLHFDGSEWTSKSPGIGAFLWDVLALSTGDYIVVGPDSTLETLH